MRIQAVLMMLPAVLTAGIAAAAPEKAAPVPVPERMPSVKAETAETAVLSGKVVETMNAGGYTYVCLEKGGKKTWVAVPEMKATVGKNMAFAPGAAMKNFYSKTLDRTFETIIFSGGPMTAGPALTLKSGAATGSKAQVQAMDKGINVEKASGADARTVGEIWAKRSALNRKKVTVRGKVVKVSPRIMDRYWVHIQDGTGNQKQGTHDLVVTSQEAPDVGDVVTVAGTVAKDRDFGAGYLYKVIVENATIRK